MLQQTQTARVVEPWHRFVVAFPTPAACASAPLSSVLQHWSGLGYPRRAKALHGAARMICDRFGGLVPAQPSQLRELPGVGAYTANAVASFAYGQPVAILDTNVGRVLARGVVNRPLGHREAQALAQDLLPRRDSRAFNQAMLDLGAQFCRAQPLCLECPVARACKWNREGGDDPAPRSAAVSRPQSRFEGSDRQLRGRILAHLGQSPQSSVRLLGRLEGIDSSRYHVALESLIRDGLIEHRGPLVQLADG